MIMKKLWLLMVFLVFLGVLSIADTDEPEEIDFLLYLPNSSDEFVNHSQAMVQLDNLAKFLLGRDLVPGQICVYGYAAVAENDIEPVNLSRDRALFVINELQKRGLPRTTFSDPIAYGEVSLWGSNTNEEDRIPNRRVRVLLDGTVLTPVTVKAAETELRTPVIDTTERAIPQKKETNSGLLWKYLIPMIIVFLILALILLMLFLAKHRKKSNAAVVQEAPPSAPPVVEKKPTPVVIEEKPAPIVKAEAPPPVVPVIVPEKKRVITVNLEEEIRLRAYEMYQERNGQDGNMDADWYRALPEICGKYERMGYEAYQEDGSWWARKEE